MGYCYIWEFIVAPESVESFSEAYRPGGVWEKLFRRSSAYVGTQLLRDLGRPGRFLTIDSWETEAGYRQFMADFESHYKALDHSLEGLASDERLIGHFHTSEDGSPVGK